MVLNKEQMVNNILYSIFKSFVFILVCWTGGLFTVCGLVLLNICQNTQSVEPFVQLIGQIALGIPFGIAWDLYLDSSSKMDNFENRIKNLEK